MSAPIITVLDAANRPIGPLSVEEVQRRLQVGEFRIDQLAHAPGFAQWTPLHAVLAHVTSSQAPPTYLHPRPPASAPAVERGPVDALAAAASAVKAQRHYAGFWLRLAAYLIDGVILGILIYGPLLLLMFVVDPAGILSDLKTGKTTAMDHEPFWVKAVTVFYVIPVTFGYFIILECSHWQGTLGKNIVGIKVTDMGGARITFPHSVGRTFAKFVSNLTCCLLYFGYLMAGFTEKKQALHDMIAGTLVLRK